MPLGSERIDTYPPPYPEGWYAVARERDVGQSRPLVVRCAGNEIALFRGSEGRVHALDAYCPHMGASLAGGRVREGEIECPFHRWRFAGDGACTGSPLGERRVPGRRTATWAVDEVHGWICVYHRPGPLERRQAEKPPYHVQRVPEITSGELVFRGEHDEGVVHMHLLEFAENSVDETHFLTVHDRLLVPWTNIPVPGFTIQHQPRWRTDDSEPHVAWFEDDAVLAFRGRPLPVTGANALIRIDGPGGLVRFDFDLNGKGRVVMFQSQTPEGPLDLRIRFRWWSERRVPKWLASYVVGNWVTQWRQDIPIWESKIYRDRPLLSDMDGPVVEMRRWYQQFYPEAE
jgi:cholesterol 7-dehydrogenase